MKIYDAVYTAAVFLQCNELCDAMNAENFTARNWREVLQGDEKNELDMLLRCCNLVLHELSETTPLRSSVVLTAKDGTISKAQLPERLRDVIKAERNGVAVPVHWYCDGLRVPQDGAYTVTCDCAPAPVELWEDSPFARDVPSARTVAYGIAREYCLISGMTDDAALWDGRFTASATSEATPKRERRVRARHWL